VEAGGPFAGCSNDVPERRAEELQSLRPLRRCVNLHWFLSGNTLAFWVRYARIITIGSAGLAILMVKAGLRIGRDGIEKSALGCGFAEAVKLLYFMAWYLEGSFELPLSGKGFAQRRNGATTGRKAWGWQMNF